MGDLGPRVGAEIDQAVHGVIVHGKVLRLDALEWSQVLVAGTDAA
jgi:hypothetical protein